VRPAVLPVVTAGSVRFTVAGEQTAAGVFIVTTGLGFTSCVLLADVVPQLPPVVVRVSVAVPL